VSGLLPDNFEVELPAGGKMYLQSADEVELWAKSMERYMEDYHLANVNDLHMLGAILQQQVLAFRATRALNGMTPELDNNQVPTGRYATQALDADDMGKYTKILNTATGEIRALEKQLGIDKASREADGAVSTQAYLRTLKRAAHARGIHITKRLVAYEGFINDLRWRLRVLENADAEDKAYHDITPEKVLDWAREELAGLEQVDKDFAHEFGKLYIGKL
jgi:hypothetical protein